MEKLVELLREACEQHGDVDFRSNYSGRGMYGDTCVGIDGDAAQCKRILAAVISEAARKLVDDVVDNQEFDEMVDTLLGYCEDSMGYGRIYYWPSLQWEEEVDSGEEGVYDSSQDALQPD